MRDYVDALERSLVRAARAETERGTVARLSRALGASPQRWGIAALLTAIVAAGVLGVVAGTRPDRALALPVLARPATDASSISIAADLRRDGADLTNARAINTYYGNAYAIPARDGGLCLAIPDPGGGYGKSCATAAQIATRGLPTSIVPPNPADAGANAKDTIAQFIAVLPATASSPIVHHANNTTTTLALHDGAATTLVKDDVTITYTINGITQTIAVPAHEPVRRFTAECNGPHGHYLVSGTKMGADPCANNHKP